MADYGRRDTGDRHYGVGGISTAGDGRPTKMLPQSCLDLRRYHHHQQLQPGMPGHCRPSSTLLRTLDRVSLTEPVWNLGRVSRAVAVHALRHSTDGVRTHHFC